MTPPGREILELARTREGDRYVLGALAPKDFAGWTGPWDCAELASWLVYQVAGVLYGVRSEQDEPAVADAWTGWWARDVERRGTKVPVEEAAAIPGAFVLRAPAPGAIGHIVVSDGQGGTMEAHSARRGVCAASLAGRRWTCGILPPGIDYGGNGRTPVPVAPPPRILRRGDRGSAVRSLQRSLAAARINPGPIDGKFGRFTEAAVIAFQRLAGLVVDGDVGPETAKALGIQLPAA